MDIVVSLTPAMLKAVTTTIIYAILTWILSLPLSFVVAFARTSKFTPLKLLAKHYINLMRGTPLLLQLMFIYFGLPYVGITFSRTSAALFAFVLNYTAYFAEIMRSGMQSIDKGQYEATKILGISKKDTFFKITLPQVIKIILPALSNESATLIKDTSLISILGIGELLRTGRTAVNALSSLVPFLMVGVIYLVLVSLTNLIFDYIEKKYSYY